MAPRFGFADGSGLRGFFRAGLVSDGADASFTDRQRRRFKQFFGSGTDAFIFHGSVVHSGDCADDDWLYPDRDCFVAASPGAGYAGGSTQSGDHRAVFVFDLLRDGAHV